MIEVISSKTDHLVRHDAYRELVYLSTEIFLLANSNNKSTEEIIKDLQEKYTTAIETALEVGWKEDKIQLAAFDGIIRGIAVLEN